MAHENRSFGTQLNGGRRAFAPLNIQNNKLNLKQQQLQRKPATTFANHLPNTLEDQENRIFSGQDKNDACKIANVDLSYLNEKTSFQIYSDHDSQKSVQNKDQEKVLNENIEAVKEELNSFLIDSLEKHVSDSSEKENQNVTIAEDSFMAVDDNEENVKENQLDDSALDHSEISFVQHYSDFERFAEYSESILNYMLEKERNFMPDPFYMNNQANINTKMRSILVDWLVDVADEYKLKDETFFLAISYIDRFLSKVSITRQEFQLLGTSALFIAAKYEEIYPPEIGEFVYITDDSFTKLQILQMEKLILTVLGFEVSAPTSNYFLEKYLCDLSLSKEVYCLSKYLCFLSMLESTPFLKYYPSEIALCSILLASKSLGQFNQISPDFIQNSLSYEQSLGSKGDVKQLINDRNTLIEELSKLHLFANEHQQQAIQRKYSTQKFHKVAKFTPSDASTTI